MMTITLMIATMFLVALLLPTPPLVSGFTCGAPTMHPRHDATTTITTTITSLLQASTSTGGDDDESLMTPTTTTITSTSANEFSRPLQTDRILKTSAGKQRRGYRDYRIAIEATPDECAALAQRFELTHLATLEAALSISPPSGGGGGSGAGGYNTVLVEGTITAHLTQTCVRTNDAFEVDVEFPLSAVIKPVSYNNMKLEDILNELTSSSSSSTDSVTTPTADEPAPKSSSIGTGKRSSKSRNKNGLRPDRIHNLNDMVELQSMIDQFDDNDGNINNQGGGDYQSEDVLEDESIYSTDTGTLDVGELVAQTFWLNLDPYPKKPGTEPMQFEISG